MPESVTIPATGSSTFAPVLSVTNVAGAVAADNGVIPEGTLLFVQTLKRWFVLDPTVGSTVDGVTVLTASGGTRRWTWVEGMYDTFWLRQARGVGNPWTINTSTGNDENVGTAASPLATWGEFARRMQPSLIDPISASITVNVTGDLAATDPIRGAFYTTAGVEIDVIFTPTNIGVQSAFTSLLLKNRATPQNWSPSDTVNANLVAGNIGYQLFDSTANAGAGAVGWVDSTAAAAQGGGGQVTLTEMFQPLVAGNGNPVLQAIANLDTYQLRRPAQARLTHLRVYFQDTTATTPIPSMRFYNAWFTNPQAAGTPQLVELLGGAGSVQFCQCRFDARVNAIFTAANTVNLFNCCFGGANGTGASSASAQAFGPGTMNVFGGGFPIGGGGSFSSLGDALIVVDGDFVHRTSTTLAQVGFNLGNVGGVQMGNVCSYGTTFFASLAFGGTLAIKVGSYATALLWGAPTVADGNLAKLGDGGQLYYTGTLSALLANLPVGSTVTFGSGTGKLSPIFLTATLAYAASPAAGMTITNLIAAQPGGYGNNVNDPISGCRIAVA